MGKRKSTPVSKVGKSKPMLVIKESPGKGIGVFAMSDIPTGTLVAIYPSLPVTDEETQGEYALYLDDQRITGSPWKGPVPAPVNLGKQIAHLFNDSAILDRSPEFPGLKTWFVQNAKYESESRANVINKGKK